MTTSVVSWLVEVSRGLADAFHRALSIAEKSALLDALEEVARLTAEVA